jgi:hypothetical protein
MVYVLAIVVRMRRAGNLRRFADLRCGGEEPRFSVGVKLPYTKLWLVI